MKKFILSISVILLFGLYSFFRSQKTPETISQRLSDPNTDLLSGDMALDNISTTTVSVNSGQYTDGTYTGSVVDVYYGNVEVQTRITEGKLADIAFLQYPNSRGNSMMISHHALPILKTEAIKAQSAEVDIVSGATQTSKGFIKSLSIALSKAKK